MKPIDYFFLAAYFFIVFFIGYISSRKSRTDSKNYFLAGSSIGWMAIGASLFASNISAEHFIGLAGSGAQGGLAVGQFEWLACFILLLLGWVFVPLYIKTGVFTMPEFLERRYNRQCRTYLSSISLIAYIFTKISVAIYAGAIVLKTILGWNIWFGAVILIVATGIYTIFGGLKAVIYTDFFQAGVLILGGLLLTALALSKAGGFSSLMSSVNPEFFNLWKPLSDADFPWTGILFGAPILGVWYWCTDQMIVQRTLATKDIENARRATIFAGFLKISPVFILVLPGVIGSVIYKDVQPNEMYATMVNDLLPAGMKGFVIAALLAALMSSLSSVFNSSSTLVVMDFYKNWRPDATERELVTAGQIFTVLLVGIGLLWLPFIGIMSSQLYIYLQSVQAYISPPIAAVFLLGIFFKRINGRGAFVTLITGFVLGAVRFVAEIGTKSGWIRWKPLVHYSSMNFLHFAVFLFAVSVIILVGVSLLTGFPSPEKLEIFRLKEADTAVSSSRKSHILNIVLSLTLSAIILSLWFYFSPLFF
ncbi:sodium:solute symporter [bacterium]|jgi:SSS family solute:Na+ symporter|nr:sodium:solute symporter [bacterium]